MTTPFFPLGDGKGGDLTAPDDYPPRYEERKKREKERRETCPRCKATGQTGETCERCGAGMRKED